MNRVCAELRLTLRRAIRLVFFRRTPKGVAGVRPPTLLVLFSLWMLSVAAVDGLWAGTQLGFDEYGIIAALAGWAIFVTAITFFSKGAIRVPLSRALADSLVLNTGFNLLLFGMGAGSLAVTIWLGSQNAFVNQVWHIVSYSLFAWLLFAFWRAGRQLWKEHHRFPGLRFLIAALLPVFLVPHHPTIYGASTSWQRYDVWYLASSYRFSSSNETGDGEQVNREPSIDFEAVLYDQPVLLNGALKRLLPSPQHKPQIYFVGMAASAAQDVFRKEVLGAQAVFDERFDTRGRSISLINSLDTAEDTPLASGTNLGLALNRIGEIMNLDKDVLVVFITSHGSREELSVSFPGFRLNQITPVGLSKILAKSRIKNRVLIISACHSGSFIPALEDSNTLIVTAAHADKTSFGCSNKRDWTYFGDAFFNHALMTTR